MTTKEILDVWNARILLNNLNRKNKVEYWKEEQISKDILFEFSCNEDGKENTTDSMTLELFGNEKFYSLGHVKDETWSGKVIYHYIPGEQGNWRDYLKNSCMMFGMIDEKYN